eukprot:763813-Hanusia_phi.AAC.2
MLAWLIRLYWRRRRRGEGEGRGREERGKGGEEMFLLRKGGEEEGEQREDRGGKMSGRKEVGSKVNVDHGNERRMRSNRIYEIGQCYPAGIRKSPFVLKVESETEREMGSEKVGDIIH